MNLRIEGQQLRFRISKEELEYLCSGYGITKSSCLSPTDRLRVDIRPEDISQTMQFALDDRSMVLSVQKQAAEDLYNALPSREGIKTKQSINKELSLELILEVDVRTQRRKRD